MEYTILLCLLIIAFLYSSVGHGGGSGYLALMALFSIEPIFMRSSALTLNLFVAGIAFYMYARGGYFKWKIFLPFALASVPMAYLGAKTNLDTTTYKIILGICLLIAVGRMLIATPKKFDTSKTPPFLPALLIGAALGFFSGMIGIGGGIILSPLLLLLHWANVKETAAVSALFILVNSSAGLIGLLDSGITINPQIFTWVLAAFVGGLLGSYSGSFKFNALGIRYILSGVLIIASIKLFLM